MDFLHPDLPLSPFASLLSTNDPPSDTEAKAVAEFLPDHLKKLSKYDEEIASITALLNRLTNERRHLQQYVTAHQGILSCIRTLPSEILQEIFLQTLDDHYDVFDTKRGPWALGHVCRRWKDISRSYPAIWTALAIESLHLQPESRRSCLPEILEEVLALTGNQELDVRYSLQSLIVNDGNTHRGRSKVLWGNRKSSFWNILQGLFDMLVGHSMRWRSASFVVPCKLGGRRLRQAKGRLSSLVSFDLSLCEGLGQGAHFDSKTLDALSVAPKLQVLTVTDVPIDVLPSLPWSQMRYLNHDLLTSVEGHLYLLAKAPLLEIYIASFYDPSPWEELELHCTHNHLRRLELSCQSSSPTLLLYLTCPVLEELSLYVRDPDHLSQMLYEFSDRSGCSLRQLSVKVRFAGNLRFLRSFTSKMNGWGHVLFPGLAVLNVIIEDGGENTPALLERLADIINARWNAGTCVGLRSVSLVIDQDNWTESEVEGQIGILQKFKEDGLDVTLKRNGKQEV